MNTNEQTMAWIMDTYSMHQRHTATAVVTGKMSVEGDVAFMAKFREMFRPIEEPQNSD